MSIYFLSEKHLMDLAEENAEKYQHAKPFTHIVLDDFLPPELLDKVLEEFPGPTDLDWVRFKDATQNKKITSEQYMMIPPFTRNVLDQLNTSLFVNFLEKLTGIEGLIPDPHYRGGGLHQTEPGGWLGIHVDFNRYNRLNLFRRINVLIYLNKDWKDEYGGYLEFWDKEMTRCMAKAAPIFNRCVIFTTSEESHHGHPDPLKCPEGMTRKSLAWYYYTADAPATIEGHTTIFRERPGKDEDYRKISKKSIIKKFVPPIIFDAYRSMKPHERRG